MATMAPTCWTGAAAMTSIDGGLGNDVIIGGGGVLPGIDTVSYESHDAVAGVFGGDVISLGQNGADGSYTRLGIVSTPTPHIGAVETDVLRGIENVTGSNRIRDDQRQRAGQYRWQAAAATIRQRRCRQRHL